MRFILLILIGTFLNIPLFGQAQLITYESKCPQPGVICEELVVEILKRAIVKSDNQRVYERLKKPSFIFAAGNKISEEYEKYFHEEDIPFIDQQFRYPAVRTLTNKHFGKKDNIKLTKKDVVNRLSGNVIFAYLPVFTKDMKTSVVYYEIWSRNVVGDLEGQAIYKVFQFDDKGDEHILQAKYAIE